MYLLLTLLVLLATSLTRCLNCFFFRKVRLYASPKLTEFQSFLYLFELDVIFDAHDDNVVSFLPPHAPSFLSIEIDLNLSLVVASFCSPPLKLMLVFAVSALQNYS